MVGLLNSTIKPKMHLQFDPPDTGIEVQLANDPYGGLGRYSDPVWNETTQSYNPGTFVYDGSNYATR